jgi:hypothetical protein
MLFLRFQFLQHGSISHSVLFYLSIHGGYLLFLYVRVHVPAISSLTMIFANLAFSFFRGYGNIPQVQ